ncbi:MAG: tubulin-like doman-containing protein, partial [Verrucomicrobiota bacterium]
MSNNYIIIGLGGTGGNIIKSFRKTVFEEFRSNTPPPPFHLSYLYVDSSKRDLKASGDWHTQDDVGEDIS